MTAAVILGVIALVGAILAWVTWHRGADERLSVEHHQHTIATLRHVADRRQGSVSPSSGRRGPASKSPPAARPSPATGRPQDARRNGASRPNSNGASRPSGNGASRPKRSASTRHDAAVPGSPHTIASTSQGAPPSRAAVAGSRQSAKLETGRRETAVVSDDTFGARPGRSGAISPSTAHRMGSQLPGAAEQARRLRRARVRRTRFVAATVAAVIGVGGAVGGVLASRRHNPTHTATRAQRPMTAARGAIATTNTTPARGSAPADATAYSATYAAPSSTYTVAIDATAPCWVMATDPATGHVVWAGTVAAGESHSLSVTGNLGVQLGAPSDASITMDGQPVTLPTGFRSPFNLTFRAGS